MVQERNWYFIDSPYTEFWSAAEDVVDGCYTVRSTRKKPQQFGSSVSDDIVRTSRQYKIDGFMRCAPEVVVRTSDVS